MSMRTTPAAIEPAFIDDAGVAELTSLGRSTVWKWAKSGQLPAPIKIGKRTLWDRREVEAHIRGLRAAA